MYYGQQEIEGVLDAAMDLNAGLEDGIVRANATVLLEALLELMTQANNLGRLIVKHAAPEHEAHSEAYIWSQIRATLEDDRSGNLRSLINEVGCGAAAKG